MAQRKPRVRKAFPTTVAQAEVSEARKQPRRWLINNPIFRLFTPIFRIIAKVLRWLAPRYFVNAFREVRLVTWPNRRETVRLTVAVFIFAIVFGGLVAVVDKGLDKIFKDVILR